MTQKHLFCWGAGYVAKALARRLLAQGWKVSGTARGEEKLDALRYLGIIPIRYDDSTIPTAEQLADVTHMLHSVAPGEDGDRVILDYHPSPKDWPALEWFGYLSTTGVYGNTDGGWVDEFSPTEPDGTRQQRRVQAEQQWLATALPIHIFRLAGIYGPGRNYLRDLRAGRARRIDKPGQVFSRIHRDDIVRALEASIASPNPGRIYNVCDDLPAPAPEVIAYAATLLEMEPPPLIPFEKAELSPMARSFYAANRRVRNNRIKQELGIQLAYPSYQEGLQTLLQQEILSNA